MVSLVQVGLAKPAMLPASELALPACFLYSFASVLPSHLCWPITQQFVWNSRIRAHHAYHDESQIYSVGYFFYIHVPVNLYAVQIGV